MQTCGGLVPKSCPTLATPCIAHRLLHCKWIPYRLNYQGSSSVGKNPLAMQESACNTGEMSLIPGCGISPGKGNGNSVQYSYLGNPMDRGAWWATAHESKVRHTIFKHDLATKPPRPRKLDLWSFVCLRKLLLSLKFANRA